MAKAKGPSPRSASRSRPPPQRGEGGKARKAKAAKRSAPTPTPPPKGRGKKLKVFRTPIGFHDAYVAAPSQKAALEAWGSDTNLFARGEAELVEDPKLAAAALERPGEVIKVPRGSVAEQVKALGKVAAKPKRRVEEDGPVRDRAVPQTALGLLTKSGVTEKEGRPRVKPGVTKRAIAARDRPPKPSREEVDAAEEALEKLDKRHRDTLRALDREEEALARRRREAERRFKSERAELKDARNAARERYERAMRAWKKKITG